MTHSVTPDGFRRSLDVIENAGRTSGRDLAQFGNVVTAVLNVQDDADTAVADAQRYLELYYGTRYTPERLHAWGPIGTRDTCAEWIRRFQGTGCQGFTFRLATMGDATTQLRRLVEEVLPRAA
jgi:alkanesulfonate monooxygenase SsuD/methylene tetrahydromethanopterin reductase-like flavin-dependent oxidoreductase (luciferase family)